MSDVVLSSHDGAVLTLTLNRPEALNALNGAQTGTLAGFEAFRTIARINLVRGLIAFPVTVAAVALGRLPGAIWALSVTAAVTCLLSHVAVRRHCTDSGIYPRLLSGWAERSTSTVKRAPGPPS